MERIICLAVGYMCGLIQSGYLYGKSQKIDIRNYGSGNSGSTNVLRVLGKKAGAIVFFGDFLKCLIPCIAVRVIFNHQPDIMYLLMMYTGLGVILGHNYPFYLNFKGGKGIAATAGLIVAMDLKLTAAELTVFLLLVIITRYVSLGSIAVAVLFFLWMVILGGGLYGVGSGYLIEFYVVAAIICIQALWRHRANIKRLLSGTESKLGSAKK